MYLIVKEFLQRYSHAWLHDHLIVYADDVHLRWTLNSIADGQCALGDLAHILHTFRSYGFNINATKSVVLFRAVGKGISKFIRRWISRTNQGPQLLIPDTPFRLPMAAKTAYLGMIIGYRAWETDTTARRIQATQHCYSILKRWFQAQSIRAHVRFRLYQQCVAPTILYGVYEMGLPTSCYKRFVSMINVHYRRMTHSPVHLTHENTTDFFLRLGAQPPWTHIAAHHRKLTTALAHKHQSLMEPDESQPDVCTLNPAYPPCAMHEYVPPTPPMPQASLACPECHRQFAQAGMLKKHLRQQHQVPCLPEDVFRPLRDSYDGRTICRHCKHQFITLYALRDHFNKRACHAFDAVQATVQPIVAREELRTHIRHRSFMGLMLDRRLCGRVLKA